MPLNTTWSDFSSTQHPIITKSTADNTKPHRKSSGKTKCITPSPINFLLLNDVHNVFHNISQMYVVISLSLKYHLLEFSLQPISLPPIYSAQKQIDPQSFIIIFIIVIYIEHPPHTNRGVRASHEITLHLS